MSILVRQNVHKQKTNTGNNKFCWWWSPPTENCIPTNKLKCIVRWVWVSYIVHWCYKAHHMHFPCSTSIYVYIALSEVVDCWQYIKLNKRLRMSYFRTIWAETQCWNDAAHGSVMECIILTFCYQFFGVSWSLWLFLGVKWYQGNMPVCTNLHC